MSVAVPREHAKTASCVVIGGRPLKNASFCDKSSTRAAFLQVASASPCLAAEDQENSGRSRRLVWVKISDGLRVAAGVLALTKNS